MANVRKPDNVHRLNGTYQKHRHGDPALKPVWNERFPSMPACLDKLARKEWKRLSAVIPPGVITLTDRSVLSQYCVLWSEFEADPLEFPAAKHAQLKLVQQELGFTPGSRSKIVGVKKSADESGFKALAK